MSTSLHSGSTHRHIGEYAGPEFTDFTKANDRQARSFCGDAPIFSTATEGLYDAYLGQFVGNARQIHTCNTCKAFIKNYGGLVRVINGKTISVAWNPDLAPVLYREVIAAMKFEVERRPVENVFYSKERVLGTPVTGRGAQKWTHFYLTTPAGAQHRARHLEPSQVMAEKSEDFKNMKRALAEFPKGLVDSAVGILEADVLYRAEKVLGPAKFLQTLHTNMSKVRQHRQKDNVLWEAVATAPPGFCHPRSSMIGTLLEDLSSGLSMTQVLQRFKEKMHPLQYQRPQAAPAAGNIAQAEKLVEKLGITPALVRRQATLKDLQLIWTPTKETPKKAETTTAFSHVKAKKETPAQPTFSTADQKKVTFNYLKNKVLPFAKKIEVFLPSGNEDYTGFTTQKDPYAPPILQWDSQDVRNPVSSYVYNGGSSAAQWGLRSNSWVEVEGITYFPWMWYGNAPSHMEQGAVFCLKGMKDTASPGACLFPETLRSELHPIRATIEGHNRSSPLVKVPRPACGVGFNHKRTVSLKLRVLAGNVEFILFVDRWE